jgi:hypothetical protein
VTKMILHPVQPSSGLYHCTCYLTVRCAEHCASRVSEKRDLGCAAAPAAPAAPAHVPQDSPTLAPPHPRQLLRLPVLHSGAHDAAGPSIAPDRAHHVWDTEPREKARRGRDAMLVLRRTARRGTSAARDEQHAHAHQEAQDSPLLPRYAPVSPLRRSPRPAAHGC